MNAQHYARSVCAKWYCSAYISSVAIEKDLRIFFIKPSISVSLEGMISVNVQRVCHFIQQKRITFLRRLTRNKNFQMSSIVFLLRLQVPSIKYGAFNNLSNQDVSNHAEVIIHDLTGCIKDDSILIILFKRRIYLHCLFLPIHLFVLEMDMQLHWFKFFTISSCLQSFIETPDS